MKSKAAPKKQRVKSSGTTSPDRAAAQLENAKQLLQRKRLRESDQVFRSLVRNGIEGLYGMGLVRLTAGKPKAAAAYFYQCLRLDNRHANSYFYLGHIFEQLSTVENARACYLKALSLKPGHLAAGARLVALESAANRAVANPGPPTPYVLAKRGAHMFEQLKRGTKAFRPAASWAVYPGRSYEGWWFLTDPNGQPLVRVKLLTNLLRVRIKASSGNKTDPVNFGGWIRENESSVIRDDKDVAQILKQIRSEWP
jgi:tetratricopeptide (TPR) repeat protein